MTQREEFERKAANGEILIKYLGVHVSVATRRNYIEEKRTETGYSSDYLNTGYEVFCAAWQAAKAQAVPEWIPVSERLPDIGVVVDLFAERSKKRISGFFYLPQLEVFRSKSTGVQYKVEKFSHWITAPAAPVKDGE